MPRRCKATVKDNKQKHPKTAASCNLPRSRVQRCAGAPRKYGRTTRIFALHDLCPSSRRSSSFGLCGQANEDELQGAADLLTVQVGLAAMWATAYAFVYSTMESTTSGEKKSLKKSLSHVGWKSSGRLRPGSVSGVNWGNPFSPPSSSSL